MLNFSLLVVNTWGLGCIVNKYLSLPVQGVCGGRAAGEEHIWETEGHDREATEVGRGL